MSAASICFNNGDTMATIKSIDDLNSIRKLIDNTMDDVWLGGNDIASEGNFVWTTGEPFTFTRWAEEDLMWGFANEPNNSGAGENCVMMSNHHGGSEDRTWHDVACKTSPPAASWNGEWVGEK